MIYFLYSFPISANNFIYNISLIFIVYNKLFFIIQRNMGAWQTEAKEKKINIYFKGVKQTLTVFDNSNESDLLNLIKKIFHIEADVSKIYLQDDEGNFLLLPKIIPDGLNIHLYVEPEFKQNTKAIKNDNSLLPGFKWDNSISLLDGKARISNDGYILGEPHQITGWTPVVSTTIYTTGKLFCKINAKFRFYQAIGVCSLDYDGKKIHWDDDNIKAICIEKEFHEMLDDGFVHSIAFLLNMNTRKFSFYELKNDKYIKKLSFSFPFEKVKIYGWVKSYGFSILEGGSSPIPSYLKND